MEKKKSPNRDEGVMRGRDAAGVRLGKSDGTVVITEEEYVHLQKMKQSLEATSRGGNEDAMTGSKFSHES